MAKDDQSTELTFKRIRAFVATVDYGTHEEAGRSLGNLTRQAISRSVAELERDTFHGRHLLEPDHRSGRGTGQPRKLRTTELGDQVYAQAKKVLAEADRLATVDVQTRPHVTIGYLPHHAEFIAPLLTPRASKGQALDISAQVLEERHRSTRVFQEQVIRNLDTGEYDIVIGPEPAGDAGLHVRKLYTAKYVALVPRSAGLRKLDTNTALDLRLLLPPPTTRAGERIRDRLNSAAFDSGRARTISSAEQVWGPNVLAESHGTKVLVIQAVAYNSGLDSTSTGAVVIVPGDIAFVFSQYGTLSGGAEMEASCEWVPFVDDDGPITHDVFATCRARRNENTDRVLDRIEKTVRARLKSKFVTFDKRPDTE